MTPLMMMTLALGAARPDGAQLLGELRKLQVVGTALYVAAHPDDENTRLLAALANETKVRAAYLAFTRGEGGQNLIGPELGPLLGVIRTQELLAARRVDGAEQFFTRARDFGYSKSVDETLAIWDHDRVLADAVYVIRELRPDVIITRFPLEAGETHGHHTASARLALEAFSAAADPKFHPEQLTSVEPWQARRIFWNAWSPDPDEKLPPFDVTWDSSHFSPLRGLSWGELAADSRSQHKSQGFGAAPVHGESKEHFVLLGGAPAKGALFDGVDLTWKRVAGSEKLLALLQKAEAEFRVDAPFKSVPTLVEALAELRRIPHNPFRAQKERELVELIGHAAGLFLEARAKTVSVTPGQPLGVKLTALKRTSAPLEVKRVKVGDLEVTPPFSAAGEKELVVKAPDTTTNPYWLQQRPGKGSWTIDARFPIGAPELAPPLIAQFEVTAGGTSFTLERPVEFRWVDPTVGERARPLEIVPPVSLQTDVDLLAFPSTAAKDLTVTVQAQGSEARSGTVALAAPEGYAVTPASASFSIARPGGSQRVRFTVRPKSKAPGVSTLTAVATLEGATFDQALTRIDYPHIPLQLVAAPAEVKLMQLDLQRGKTKRVGYIPGAGDEVPAALRQVGYEVTTLGDEALRDGDLEAFDAIVVGIRAYNVNPVLAQVYGRLMQYVKDGGTLVAQYNTRNWLSSVPAELGPLPFELSRDRVTDETAKVTLGKHRVLETPNRITDADFEGWVQERGLYFAVKADPGYATPLAMNDPGEAPLTGSLLVAQSGKGRFVYTGLSFFRQLPAGVPGAYRLFANLLDHGR